MISGNEKRKSMKHLFPNETKFHRNFIKANVIKKTEPRGEKIGGRRFKK